jgi:peroxiredoxin Q/BCP
MLKQGDAAIDFVLRNQDDENVRLADFKGKWLVLYFYPRDNTSGCTREACDFTGLLPDFTGIDAVVVGVSPDPPARHRNFIEKHDLKIMLLSDPEKEVMRGYGAVGMKKNYGREYEGVVRSTFIISPDQHIAASWRNVRVRRKVKGVEKRHAEDVLGKLRELQT